MGEDKDRESCTQDTAERVAGKWWAGWRVVNEMSQFGVPG